MVVVGTDKHTQQDYATEIIKLCEQHHIPWIKRKTPFDFKSKYAIAISWRWLLPTENQQLIVFHDSLLPTYRGFAPLVNQLIEGETTIGVTALFAAAEYDRGDIIQQAKTTISYPLTISAAIECIAPLYGHLLTSIFRQLATTPTLPATPQQEAAATYSLWRDEADYAIDWTQSASRIRRKIDAVGFPYLGARCTYDGQLITVQQASEVPDVNIVNRDVGKVIFMRDQRPIVVCGTGLLKLEAAVFVDSNESIFPLKSFRTRFQ